MTKQEENYFSSLGPSHEISMAQKFENLMTPHTNTDNQGSVNEDSKYVLQNYFF